MFRYECFYKKDRAGYLEAAEEIRCGENNYRFMPYRSRAHLKLAKLVKNEKLPIVELASEQDIIEAEVLKISPDSITVKIKQIGSKKSLFRKIFTRGDGVRP
ncbi:MAG: hypothetical protein PVH87_02030 [Desulfobacteraceae bacterium]|jgi:hypothetical protein